jgi:hypothetical protein
MNHQDRYSSINSATRSLALMLVVLLMLLAPCKVRHAIHAQLQVPVTKSLNVTKAALSTSTLCQVSPELAVKKKAGSKTNPDCGFPALLPETLHPVLLIAGSGSQKLVVADRYWTGAVPLYILYRKMRVLS